MILATSLLDWATLGLVLVTALGVAAAFVQLRASARTQRATFLKDLYLQLRTDGDIREAFYKIEYSEFVYSADFHGSELEPKIDRLLALIDLVCELRAQRIISDREMSFFSYEFERVGGDPHVRDYLAFLNHWYEDNDLTAKPFGAFQAYGSARPQLFKP
jgi:hypothetical protein